RVVESLIKAGTFDSLGHPRKGLYQVHRAAIDIVMASKRAAAIGQLELFGDPTPDAATSRPFDVPVPAAHWDAQRQLAFERDMLGCYVSGHPLQEWRTSWLTGRTLRSHRSKVGTSPMVPR
ncbi:MAG TPA: hypothetical protein VJS67_06540, partial [Pseudonocardiaceae bacterium]|nr:hypothetical protein [Pseudonocardiaceae bacterium]